MATAAVAVIARRERELVDVFRAAGATSLSTARSFGDLGVDENVATRRLRRRAVLREAAPGLWYLDEPSWEAMRTMRQRVGFLLLFLVALAAIFGVFTTSAYRGVPRAPAPVIAPAPVVAPSAPAPVIAPAPPAPDAPPAPTPAPAR
jgi:hypothetical protein